LTRLQRILLGASVGAVLVIGSGIGLLRSDWARAYTQRRAIEFLEERLDAHVELAAVDVRLFPRLAVSGRGLAVTRAVDDDGLPVVSIDAFEISGSPWQMLRRRVTNVTLDGLVLRVRRGTGTGTRSGPPTSGDVRIDAVTVRNGRLLIVPSNPEKFPLEFGLHEVTLSDFGFDRASTFSAQVTNPRPTALIRSEGRIGPWDTRSISDTPLAGQYTMQDGDLGSIKGIGGRLESTGRFEGILERLHVEGSTSSPDFHLDIARHDLPLTTTFVATVDGTSGDTTLEQVDVTLGESKLMARGSVLSTPGVKGRSISLAVKTSDARFEDLLHLAIRGDGEPPMRGTLTLDTSLLLPPSEQEVPLRLQLEGRFDITDGRFTSDTVQNRVDELSRRGRGQPRNMAVDNVLSSFGGVFSMNDGVVRLPRIQFSVNGARVDLGGSYRLPTETMAFRGTLRLDAPVSKTVTGIKSFFLKAVDPLFRRNGAGTELPIAITGTVSKPSFRVEPGRIFRRN